MSHYRLLTCNYDELRAARTVRASIAFDSALRAPLRPGPMLRHHDSHPGPTSAANIGHPTKDASRTLDQPHAACTIQKHRARGNQSRPRTPARVSRSVDLINRFGKIMSASRRTLTIERVTHASLQVLTRQALKPAPDLHKCRQGLPSLAT